MESRLLLSAATLDLGFQGTGPGPALSASSGPLGAPIGLSADQFGDFNGDDIRDLAELDNQTSRHSIIGVLSDGRLFVSASNGERFVTSQWGTMSAATNWQDLMVGDFNGDGDQDLAARDAATGQWTTWLADGDRFATQEWGGRWSRNVTWEFVQTGDFDGNGFDDIIGRAQSGAWYAAMSDGTQFSVNYVAAWTTDVSWTDVNVGDFNGDGKGDIAGRASSGTWAILQSQPGGGHANKNAGRWSTNVTWHDVSVGDFNNDGKSDIIGRAGTGSWYAGYGTSGAFHMDFVGSWSTNTTWSDVSVGDFNGDGHSDIAGRTADGRWYIFRPGDAYSITGRFQMDYAIEWSSAVNWSDVHAGDFDGNGTWDLAGRSDSGKWIVSLSSSEGFMSDTWANWNPSSNWLLVNVLLAMAGTATAGSGGIWISPDELASRPTGGDAWNSLIKKAEGSLGTANVGDQDSKHDTATMAVALAAVRTGRSDLRQKAINALLSARYTEVNDRGRWLAVGRNVGAYVIAADVLGLRADGNPSSPGTQIETWLAGFLTRTLAHNNNSSKQITLRESAWSSGSNAAAQEGFVHVALAAYLDRKDELDWAWNAFRRYAGDRTSPHTISHNDETWQVDPSDPVGIQDPGATRDGFRLDGAIGNDMSRGGTFSGVPGYTQYPWVGLEGAVPAAVVLQRAGYPAFDIVDNALNRALDYLWEVRTVTGNEDWFDGDRANEIIHLVNVAYGTQFLFNGPSGDGRTIGWTDFTHDAASIRVGDSVSSTTSNSPGTPSEGSHAFVDKFAADDSLIHDQPAGLLDGRNAAGNLSGSVDNAQGISTITGITVPIGDPDASGNVVIRSMQTIVDGSDTFNRLPPGDYSIGKLQVVGNDDGLELIGTTNGARIGDNLASDIISSAVPTQPRFVAEDYNIDDRSEPFLDSATSIDEDVVPTLSGARFAFAGGIPTSISNDSDQVTASQIVDSHERYVTEQLPKPKRHFDFADYVQIP